MRLKAIVRRTLTGFVHDRITDLAAMLTYYTLFALFPALLFVVTLTLLFLPAETMNDAFRMAAETMPGAVAGMLEGELRRAMETAGGGFVIAGAALALWGASRGAAALHTALNDIHEVKETRPWWKVQLLAVGVTLGVAVLIVTALGLLVLGPVAGHWLADRFGLGGVFDVAWAILRWLFAALLVMFVWGCLYYFLPNIKRRFRWVTPGAIVGVILWLAASRGFIWYAENFGKYDKTYGALGAVILFLTWLWISNVALLMGGEVDDAIDELRRKSGEQAGQLPATEAAFPKQTPQATPAKASLLEAKERQDVEDKKTHLTRPGDGRVAPATNGGGLGDLARRIGDDVTALAKDHVELARLELARSTKATLAHSLVVILGGVLGMIGFAMLCVTAIAALAPVIPPLWLRLLLMSLVYMGVGGLVVLAFAKRLRGDVPPDLSKSKREARRTTRVLKEQLHHG